MGTLRRRLRRLSIGPRAGPAKTVATAALRNGDELLSHRDWRVRLSNPTQDGRPDLRDVDFRGRALKDIDFSACRLDRSVFDGASLDRAVFTGADLSGTSFVAASLVGARMDAVRGLDGRFDRALLTGSSFIAANLAFTSFRHSLLDGADLRSATFFKADLRTASFRATTRAGVDFEEADTSCVLGGGARSDAWTATASACNAPSFASALRHFLSLLRLGDRAEPGLRAIEAGIECSQDPQHEVRGVLSSQLGWRIHLIAASAIALGGADEDTLELLWSVISRGSWASPQLVAAAALSDPKFVERAVPLLSDARVPSKGRGAVAAELLTRFRASIGSRAETIALELGATERDGFSFAAEWSARFEDLTEPTTDWPRP